MIVKKQFNRFKFVYFFQNFVLILKTGTNRILINLTKLNRPYIHYGK